MMARSTRGSNQRPDTLMQDRTSANSMKVLLQRTAGPYIWVKSGRDASGQVLFMSAWPQKQTSECCRGMPALCQKRIAARQPLFVHLVGAGEQLSTWPLYTPI